MANWKKERGYQHPQNADEVLSTDDVAGYGNPPRLPREPGTGLGRELDEVEIEVDRDAAGRAVGKRKPATA